MLFGVSPAESSHPTGPINARTVGTFFVIQQRGKKYGASVIHNLAIEDTDLSAISLYVDKQNIRTYKDTSDKLDTCLEDGANLPDTFVQVS